jgi:hypothetical protein
MVQRRALAAGLPVLIGCPIPSAPPESPPTWKPVARWRTLKRWQHTKAHARPNYMDRTGDEIALEEVERIRI